MRIAIPRETHDLERRVAATPDTVSRLIALGHEVTVEARAGAAAGFANDAYRSAGAHVEVDPETVWSKADMILRVRPPRDDQIAWLRSGAILTGYLNAATSPDLLETLAGRGVTSLAMEAVPRITRAQSMDTLSAMANIAGYRAVIEAAGYFGRFFGGQMTAAGRFAPAQVLVIGAGVAGLAAVGAARNLGAQVRAFDTREACRDQVHSLGGEFLTVDIEESGEGSGGYAREMSQSFLDAEFALFREQAEEVDIVITTALIPGKPAPRLWHADMVARMKPGSVVVDLAGEQGGNCDLSEPDETVVSDNGVVVLAPTDLPSRMAETASTLHGNVVVNLVEHLGGREIAIDMDDEITRAMTVTHDGAVTWPPPAPEPAPTPQPAASEPEAADATAAVAAGQPPTRPAAELGTADRQRHRAWLPVTGLLLAAVWVYLRWQFGGPGQATGTEAQAFVQHLTVFVMACFVGWHVIWNVTPALHTPLMAVTNAISGIIILGGLQQGSRPLLGADGSVEPVAVFGLAAILLAMINVAGGFLVTQRMLRMFRKG
ncbi:Re/Si-specific NAD(P)(+) transhydrogenase subunit alpha [bacterium]|nr:Re/Si-specific NAD(P)(+) transhydrogenase subunit alpha [bacterium]